MTLRPVPAPREKRDGICMSFESLGLPAPLLRSLQELGYTTPTPIQLNAIPAVHAGRDLLAAAQTGTGKTAAFALPLLQRLDEEHPNPRGSRAPRLLVLVPTRELAAQVGEAFQQYGSHLSQRTILVFGGVSPRPQVEALRQGVDIVVATPGRLLDHINRARDRRDEDPLPGARRSRPYAGHGLHPRHPPRTGRVAEEAAEPAVLGDLQRRRSARSPRACCTTRSRSRWRRATRRPSWSSTVCTSSSRARSGRC